VFFCAIFASKNSDMRFFSTCDLFPAGSRGWPIFTVASPSKNGGPYFAG